MPLFYYFFECTVPSKSQASATARFALTSLADRFCAPARESALHLVEKCRVFLSAIRKASHRPSVSIRVRANSQQAHQNPPWAAARPRREESRPLPCAECTWYSV